MSERTNRNAPRIVQVLAGQPERDIVERLEARAYGEPTPPMRDGELMLDAAALIRQLDGAINHMVAVKGSIGLNARSLAVLNDAMARHRRRAECALPDDGGAR